MYRIVTPGVVVDISTSCGVAYVPPLGTVVRGATVIVIGFAAMLLGGRPATNAFALRVAVWPTTTLPPDATEGSARVGSTPVVV